MLRYAANTNLTYSGDWYITFVPWFYSTITQGTWIWNGNSNQKWYGYWYNSSNAQNDQIDYLIYLDAGTYTWSHLTTTDPSRAIVTLLIDSVAAGTVDCYSAGTSYNQLKSITGISIASPGFKTLSLKAASRHASATQWYITITNMVMRRTA